MIAFNETNYNIDYQGKERTVVTSALPYVHGLPHLGNIVGSLLPADIYHRFLDLIGHQNVYICGSDVHGTPIEVKSLKEDVEPSEIADKNHKKAKNVLENFNLEFSIYSRTDSHFNREITHRFFKRLYKRGFIMEKEQELPYCNNCERFLADRFVEGECPECGGLGRGDQCDDCGALLEPKELIEPYCTICEGKNIEFKTTRNLFLQLEKFEDELRDWVSQGRAIPNKFKKEVSNLIQEGLEDRCITRDMKYGFDVPVQEINQEIEEENLSLEKLDPEIYQEKTIYVWFDAPIGYVSFTKDLFSNSEDPDYWENYWKDDSAGTIYSIGKDNLIFHSIIWPSILSGSDDGFTLPTYEFVHHYLLAEGIKFSKSRGKGLSSEKALEIIDKERVEDYWRFYLSLMIPLNQDKTFTFDDFTARINNILNDTIGNFVNRVLSLTDQWFDNQVPKGVEPDQRVINDLKDLLEEYKTSFDNYKLTEALEASIKIAKLGDSYLAEEEPWKSDDPEKKKQVIYTALQLVKYLALTLYPFIPASANKIWQFLNLGDRIVHSKSLDRSGESSNEKDKFAVKLSPEKIEFLQPGHELNQKEILFEKIETDKLKEKVQKDEKSDQAKGEQPMSMVKFSEFQEMDLRTGEIKEVKEHPNADELVILKINVGDKIKQSVAGLKEYYTEDELEGKEVVVLNNLEPAELRGKKSECMVMAAVTEDEEEVVLLKPDGDVPLGTKVR